MRLLYFQKLIKYRTFKNVHRYFVQYFVTNLFEERKLMQINLCELSFESDVPHVEVHDVEIVQT